MKPFENTDVVLAFEAFDLPKRAALLRLLDLIFEVALRMHLEVEESLKWGQPSYVTTSKIGTPIRLGTTKEGIAAVFFNCQTTLFSSFRLVFLSLSYEKNRGILLNDLVSLPLEELEFCIAQAFTYHKKRKRESEEL